MHLLYELRRPLSPIPTVKRTGVPKTRHPPSSVFDSSARKPLNGTRLILICKYYYRIIP